MSSKSIDEMIPDSIKLTNAQKFSQMHQSSLFLFDAQQPKAWRKTWEYVIDRLDLEQTPPSLKLEKDETQSGEEATFKLDLGDNDARWFLICHHFGITHWTQEGLKCKLVEDFYGDNLQLKHPESEQVKSLSEHIEDFLDKYPHGGTKNVTCDMSELFTLEEID